MSSSEVEAFLMDSLPSDGVVALERVDCDGGLADEVGDTTSCSYKVEGLPAVGPFDVTVDKDDDGNLVPTYITGRPIVGPP